MSLLRSFILSIFQSPTWHEHNSAGSGEMLKEGTSASWQPGSSQKSCYSPGSLFGTSHAHPTLFRRHLSSSDAETLCRKTIRTHFFVDFPPPLAFKIYKHYTQNSLGARLLSPDCTWPIQMTPFNVMSRYLCDQQDASIDPIIHINHKTLWNY